MTLTIDLILKGPLFKGGEVIPKNKLNIRLLQDENNEWVSDIQVILINTGLKIGNNRKTAKTFSNEI